MKIKLEIFLEVDLVRLKKSRKVDPQLPAVADSAAVIQPPVSQSLSNRKPFSQKKVLILAEYRSGSTFTSEIFNKVSQALYLFEPLLLAIGDTAQQLKILNQIYQNCSYPTVSDYLTPSYLQKYAHLISPTFNRCSSHGICGREMSDIFVNSTFCDEFEFSSFSGKSLKNSSKNLLIRARRKNLVPQKPKLCQKITPNIFQQVCQSKKIISAKVIRMNLIEKAASLFENDNFYLIYLIRDPRATYVSRNKIEKFDQKYGSKNDPRFISQLEKSCHNFRDNLAYLRDLALSAESPEKIKQRQILSRIVPVRYEDLATRPEYVVSKIYEIMYPNLEERSIYLQEVSQIIEILKQKTRHSASTGSSRSVQATPVRRLRKNNLFSVEPRNASQIISKWRFSLDFEQTKIIQDACGDKILNLLGYWRQVSSIFFLFLP